ncbi:MAG TPA: mechanosensitive ion channel family protein [Actinobacteria bacterium]|nr:mechanosensitive ion channel family protein [Actinomycetota bacterium]
MDVLAEFLRIRAATLVQSVFVIVGVVVVWWLLGRAGAAWLGRREARLAREDPLHRTEKLQRLETLWAVARSLLGIVAVTVAVLTLFALWGIPIGPVLAVGSVVGVAVGFGAQSVIKDVIAGFLIVVEDQYAIGDVVEVAGVGGAVEELRLRVTVLRDLDGKRHYVPNGEIRVATNFTQEFSRVVVDVGVGYGEDVDRALEVLASEAAALAEDEAWREAIVREPEVLGVDDLDDWSVTLRVVFTTDTSRRWAVRREFLRRIKKRFDAEGIEIPFPYRNVILHHEGSPDP